MTDRVVSPGSFLFVTWSGGGNTFPLAALAARLRRRGHVVRVLGPAELRRKFKSDGAEFSAYRGRAEVAAGLDRAAAAPLVVAALAEDFLACAARQLPDLIVVDFMMPEVLSAAELTGAPVVAFVHTLYSDQAIIDATPMNMSGGMAAINTLREGLGLAPAESLQDLLHAAEIVLVVTARTLDGPREPVPANVRFAGPIMEDAGSDAAWPPPFDDPSLPLVHVSMGTVAEDHQAHPIIQAALDGLAEMRANVLVTLPRAADQPWLANPPPSGEAFTIPANAKVVPFVRHAAVLPHTSVFVTHAGLGSVGAGLTFGVPMLCLPIFLEQPQNAAAVERIGAGLVLPKSSSPEAIRAAVERLLAEPSFAKAARRIAAELAADGNGEIAVRELEALLP